MKKNISIKKLATEYFIITLGSAIMAISFNLFLEPSKIAPGGVSGIAILINYITSIPTGQLIFLLNIPLFVMSYIVFGKKFIFSTFYSVIIQSAIVDLTSKLSPFTTDALLAALYGGITLGGGMGLIFISGATSGGSDILGRFVKLKYPHIRLGRVLLFVDLIIVVASAVVFNDVNSALYAIITLYVSSIVIDAIIYGLDYARVAYIISEKSDLFKEKIQNRLSRGVTVLYGEGGYLKQPKKILMCAVKRQQTEELRKIVAEIDPDAFVIMTQAYEVFGDGFKNYNMKSF